MLNFPFKKIFLTILFIQFVYCMFSSDFAQIIKPTSESIEFIQNKNQWESNILYKAEIGGGTVFLEKNCFTFAFKDMKAIDKILSFKYVPTEERPKLTP